MPVRVAEERAPLCRETDTIEETGELAKVGVKVNAFSELAVFVDKQMGLRVLTAVEHLR